MIRSAGNFDAAHGHEHCWIAAHIREWLPLPEDELSAWAVLPPESIEPGSLAFEVRPSAISLLRLAPKTSPPLGSNGSDLSRA
ncbi:MAG TPA: hypothetical protein VG963_32290 [Polyangiaceae bacterium]|nr:hypothetical protein [Polyangiaceae bacterium]